MSAWTFFAVAPPGLEAVVRAEIVALGGRAPEEVRGGVRFCGDLDVGLAACLWLRAASRVLVALERFEVAGYDDLYDRVRAIRWEDHLPSGATFAVRTTARRSVLERPGFATLRIKDAVVDRLRETRGARPSVDRHAPDLPVAVHLAGRTATVYVDLSRGSLHRRGYREASGPAPIKEHLAAGLLALAGFDPAEPDLHDPCCGGGTFVVEAALWALDVAPGLLRGEPPALNWGALESARYERLWSEARERAQAARASRRFELRGTDADPQAVARADRAAERAGVAGHVTFARAEVADLPVDPDVSLVVANLPYGKRLAGAGEAATAELLGHLRRVRPSARRCVLLPEPAAEILGADGTALARVRNGPVACRFVAFEPGGAQAAAAVASGPRPRRGTAAADPDIEAFAARVRKREAHLRKWARRRGVEAYRVYDADVPAVALVVERYGPRVCVWEYAPPPEIPAAKAAARRRAALERLSDLLDVAPADIVYKVRQRARGGRLEGTTGRPPRPFVVAEGPFRFRVELDARLDTGLYLDHRGTRAHLREVARGKRFLNLFAYTGSATVAAALGGACETVSVDLSRTYLDWLGENLALAGLSGGRHRTVRGCALRFVEGLARRGETFDLVFVDPPTYSVSKGMDGAFDVVRDHGRLLTGLLAALRPGGRIYFAAHRRGFRLDGAAVEAAGGHIEEWTGRFRQPDFPTGKGRPPPHRLFAITRR